MLTAYHITELSCNKFFIAKKEAKKKNILHFQSSAFSNSGDTIASITVHVAIPVVLVMHKSA